MEGGADVPRLLLLLVVVLALVRPAHPANNRPPERMANERNLIFCVNFEGMDLNIGYRLSHKLCVEMKHVLLSRNYRSGTAFTADQQSQKETTAQMRPLVSNVPKSV
jgi:hypothetical protein